MMIDTILMFVLPLLMGYARVVQGDAPIPHAKAMVKAIYILACFWMPWDHWWQGLVWGLFIAYFYLNAWHEYGDEPRRDGDPGFRGGFDAVKRYWWNGIGYWVSYKVGLKKWTVWGEFYLGTSVGATSYFISTSQNEFVYGVLRWIKALS